MVRIPPLSTERLIIRGFRAGDLGAVHGLNRALAGDNLGHPPQTSRRSARAWLAWTMRTYDQHELLSQPPYGDLAVELAATGEVVGMVGNVPLLAPFGRLPSLRSGAPEALEHRATCELGLFWAIHPTHRRRGYAREAARALMEYDFEHLGLRRIVAMTTRDNLASQAVMRSLGMRVEENPTREPYWFQVVGMLERGKVPVEAAERSLL
jgi:RimJ/RimL family protein N-acetyltransferase